jgi:uncharacterized DUF497 family protein
MTPLIFEMIDWDDENEEHLKRHTITYDDVYDVLHGPTARLQDKDPRTDRWKILGYTLGGRPLTLKCSYDPIRRVLRPITGWTATAQERTRYFRKMRPDGGSS